MNLFKRFTAAAALIAAVAGPVTAPAPPPLPSGGTAPVVMGKSWCC